ncbi:MFS transporter [Paraburkholderia phymatum]|uniref:Major facilitator superfamily MFS_1 n=1 Tax=Paraburkholderia phymatum (strain DSM 17167 / CIP 108236 / LMG 21445 / STM815) TaxID=391038 RepID=B2JNY1_PARP8|nr:MFS transporter [Paraburkholderia phymatum]ACC74534.1 major facilitator superfamily MFS_1 [Paraburkholderia phymatum STM815]
MRAHRHAFFASLFFSRLADQILLFLVPLVVFQTTQQATWSGIAFFIEAFPRYLVFPVCGALCDRISPVKVLRASQRCRAIACVAGIAGFSIVGGIGWLIALSAVCGALTSQGLVAREVLLPQVFSSERFEKVLSYAQIADQMGVVLGPILAGVLLGWWRWEYVVGIAALLFFAADGATLLWEHVSAFEWRAHQHVAAVEWLAPVKTALAHVVRLPGLGRLVALAAAENLVIGATLATSAAMVTGLHRRPDAFYTFVQTAGAVATIAILLLIARVRIPRKALGRVSFLAIFAGGLLAGLSPSVWGYVAGFLLIVGFDKMFSIYIRSVRQAIIPAKDYGKTLGVVIMLNNLTQPLAGLLVGMFAGNGRMSEVVVGISLGMGALGAVVVLAGRGAGRRRAAAHGQTRAE